MTSHSQLCGGQCRSYFSDDGTNKRTWRDRSRLTNYSYREAGKNGLRFPGRGTVSTSPESGGGWINDGTYATSQTASYLCIQKFIVPVRGISQPQDLGELV